MPVLAFLFNGWKLLAAVIAFNKPAPHQDISTEPEANRLIVTANGLCKHFAGATASMMNGVEI